MVYLILSREGFNHLRVVVEELKNPVWVTSNVLDRREINEYRERGMDLTVFDHTIDYNDKARLKSEIEMVKLHHPGMQVKVEQ